MNREEREEYVIRLYKEGRSVRQIAELVHMSFRDIGAITNKVITSQPKSSESKAFKMFSEGKSPVNVAILLDLAADLLLHIRIPE